MQHTSNIAKSTALIVCALALTAISAIACHVLGWCDLYWSARVVVIPAFCLIAMLAFKHPNLGKKILKGWLYGLMAVSIYDLSRIPFMMAGWGDFIPTIGDWILGESDVHPIVGYAWRYIGNGGGLGIVFVLMNHYFPVNIHRVLLGLLYGLFVFSCLDLVLVSSKNAQNMMFELTSLNVVGSMVGHIVYGSVLGILSYYRVYESVRDGGVVEVIE